MLMLPVVLARRIARNCVRNISGFSKREADAAQAEEWIGFVLGEGHAGHLVGAEVDCAHHDGLTAAAPWRLPSRPRFVLLRLARYRAREQNSVR